MLMLRMLVQGVLMPEELISKMPILGVLVSGVFVLIVLVQLNA